MALQLASTGPTDGPRRRWWHLSLSLVAIAAGACSSEPTESNLLSGEEFSAQGNQICTDLFSDLRTMLEAGTDENGSVSIETYELINEARNAGFAELFALQPPAELEADFQNLQDIRQEFVDAESARIPEPDINLRLGPQWDETATRLNLGSCIT